MKNKYPFILILNYLGLISLALVPTCILLNQAEIADKFTVAAFIFLGIMLVGLLLEERKK